jgi:hypothetical protein
MKKEEARVKMSTEVQQQKHTKEVKKVPSACKAEQNDQEEDE